MKLYVPIIIILVIVILLIVLWVAYDVSAVHQQTTTLSYTFTNVNLDSVDGLELKKCKVTFLTNPQEDKSIDKDISEYINGINNTVIVSDREKFKIANPDGKKLTVVKRSPSLRYLCRLFHDQVHEIVKGRTRLLSISLSDGQSKIEHTRYKLSNYDI